MHLEQSDGTDGKESQDGADTLTTRDNDNIIVRGLVVLADSGLDVRVRVEGVVAKADGVSLVASLEDSTGSVAAGLVDSGARNSALLIALVVALGVTTGLGVTASLGVVIALGVTTSLGVVTTLVVVTLGVRSVVVSVLADSGLDVGGNIEGVVAKADSVLGLAGLDVVAVNGAALVVDSGALDTALLLRARLGVVLGVRVAAVVLGVVTLVVTLGVGTVVVTVLADSRLDVGGDIEGAVAEADSVLLLADLDISTGDKAAFIVDGGALDAALLVGTVLGVVTLVGVVALVVTLGVVARAAGLANGRLHVRGDVEGAVTKADSVLLLADSDISTRDSAALIVDSCALKAALLISVLDLLLAVAVVLGVVVVLAVLALVLLVVGLLVLADRRLNPRLDIEGVVSEADSVLLLADGDIGTRDSTALIVDGGALEAAVFGSVVTLVVRRRRRRVVASLVVRAVLLVEVALVVLVLVIDVVLLVVLAGGGLGVERVVTETDSVRGLADSDVGTRVGAALIVDSGTFVTANLGSEAASASDGALAILMLGRVGVVLAGAGLDVGVDVEGVEAKADGVALLADSDVSTGDGTALVVNGDTLVGADLGAGGLGGLDHGGHGHGGGVSDGVGDDSGDRGGDVHATSGGGEVLSGGTRSHLSQSTRAHGHGQKTGQSVGVSHLDRSDTEKESVLSWIKKQKQLKSE
jgi:hypothetical protein